MNPTIQSKVWLEGFAFPEAPRWHKGKWWFVDMYLGHIWCAAPDEAPQLIVDWDSYVSGLGWLPNGDLLFVDMINRAVMRHSTKGITLHADLSSISTSPCNDMLTLSNGISYVGTYGYDLHANAVFQKGELIRILPNGEVSLAAPDLAFPNGMVLTSDEQQLIVAETAGRRLTAFQIDENGKQLSARHSWAYVERGFPDGITIDNTDKIWVAAVGNKKGIVRIGAGGEVLGVIHTTQQPIACMIGGTANQKIFITTVAANNSDTPEILNQNKKGKIEIADISNF